MDSLHKNPGRDSFAFSGLKPRMDWNNGFPWASGLCQQSIIGCPLVPLQHSSYCHTCTYSGALQGFLSPGPGRSCGLPQCVRLLDILETPSHQQVGARSSFSCSVLCTLSKGQGNSSLHRQHDSCLFCQQGGGGEFS